MNMKKWIIYSPLFFKIRLEEKLKVDRLSTHCPIKVQITQMVQQQKKHGMNPVEHDKLEIFKQFENTNTAAYVSLNVCVCV